MCLIADPLLCLELVSFTSTAEAKQKIRGIFTRFGTMGRAGKFAWIISPL